MHQNHPGRPLLTGGSPELTSEGEDHVTQRRPAVVDEEDSLHVERHKLAIVHLIKPRHAHTRTRTQCFSREAPAGLQLGRGHSHHSVRVAELAQPGPRSQERHQDQDQVHLKSGHQWKPHHAGYLPTGETRWTLVLALIGSTVRRSKAKGQEIQNGAPRYCSMFGSSRTAQ